MNNLQTLLLIISSLLVILMLLDRLLQAIGHPPAKWFDIVQLLVAASGIFVHGTVFGGLIWAIKLFLLLLIIPAIVESIGMRTGLPFGKYKYTDNAGPVLPGGVPVAVVMMWWGLLYVAYNTSIAFLELFAIPNNNYIVAIFAGLFVTGWDLVGDPVAVNAGMWNWEKEGKYAGIPFTNFAGWFVTGTVCLFAAILLSGKPELGSESLVANWLLFIPTLLFGILLLNYAGAANKRGLKLPAILGLIQGIIVSAVYVFAVI